MKKILSILAIAVFALNVTAQEVKKEKKKKCCKRKKECSKENTATTAVSSADTVKVVNTSTTTTTNTTTTVAPVVTTANLPAPDLVWYDDINVAMKLSNETNKPLMLFFTGSDWCGWCKRLQAEVFYKDEFKTWAANNVILVEVDFPNAVPQSEALKKQNRDLQTKFPVKGYPTCHFAAVQKNADGTFNMIGKGATGYVSGGPTPWIATATPLISK